MISIFLRIRREIWFEHSYLNTFYCGILKLIHEHHTRMLEWIHPPFYVFMQNRFFFKLIKNDIKSHFIERFRNYQGFIVVFFYPYQYFQLILIKFDSNIFSQTSFHNFRYMYKEFLVYWLEIISNIKSSFFSYCSNLLDVIQSLLFFFPSNCRYLFF